MTAEHRRLPRYRLWAANSAMFSIFVVWTLGMMVWFPLYVLGLMARKSRFARANRCGIWMYARTLMRLLSPFIPVHIDNVDMVKRHAPCILIANHLSFLDLYLFGLQDEPDLCMLTKTWPFRLLFFFAPAMYAAGYINVDLLSPEETEQRAMQRLAEGATVIIFPEGRRSRDGATGRFRAGAFRLAQRAGVPVVPLVITGSDAVCAPGRKFLHPGPVVMRFLPPLRPEAFAHEALPHRAMLRAAAKLYPRAQGASTSYSIAQ